MTLQLDYLVYYLDNRVDDTLTETGLSQWFYKINGIGYPPQ